jgi:glutamate:GABA antiporter
MVGAWIATLLPMLYVGIACYFLLIPTDVYLQNNRLDRLTFELTHFVPLACIVLLTIALYIWGHKERQNRDAHVDLG